MAPQLSNTYLNISLSPTLTSQLQLTSNSGYVFMDAVWFDQSGATHWTPMVEQSHLLSGGTYSIQLPQTSSNFGGKLYFLISSVPNTQQTDPLSGYNYATQSFTGTPLITTQSQISYVSTGANPDTSGATNSYTFDSLEFAVQGSKYDVANLTSVVGSGIPMGFSTTLPPTQAGAAGFAASDATIASNIQQKVSNITGAFNSGPLSGNADFIISPASNGQTAYSSTDWKPYLDKLVANGNNFTTNISNISGVFNGALDGQAVYQNGLFYNYKVTAGTYTDGVNYFVFTPAANSQAQQLIIMTEGQLAKSIYAQQGSAYIYQKTSAGGWSLFTPNNSAAMQHTGSSDAQYTNDGFNSSGQMNVGWNNAWGNVFTNFVTSIDTGQLGVKGVSPNPNVSQIDLNSSWNISPAYAFGGTNNNTNTTALTTGPSAINTATQQYYDTYAKQFFISTNSYGNAYTDNATKSYSAGGPDINITNGVTDLSQLYLKLFSFNESNVPTIPSPTANDYVTPILNNYIAPPNTSQGAANWYGYTQTLLPTGKGGLYTTNGQVQINFDLGTANGGSPNVIAPNATWAAFQMMDPHTGQFIYTGLNPNSGYVQQLQYTAKTDGAGHFITGTLSVSPQTYFTTLPGEILLNGLPIANGGTYWFEISEGDAAGHQKDFNLYLKTAASGDLFGTGSSLMIDGGASVIAATGNGGINGADINLNIGSNILVNGNTMTIGAYAPSGSSYAIAGAPTSPVVGLYSGVQGNALSSLSTAYVTQYGGSNGTQGTTDTNTTVSVTQAELPYLALGWTGLNDVNTGSVANPAYYASSWIGGFTNKAAGGDIIWATVKGANGSTYYLGDVAQADGQWALSQWYDSGYNAISVPSLAVGAYTITTQELDPHSLAPLAAQSSTLTLNVIAVSSAQVVGATVATALHHDLIA